MERRNRILKLVRSVQTNPTYTEAEHEACRTMLPVLVDAALLGEAIPDRFAEIVAHLDTCATCNAEYAALLDMLSQSDLEASLTEVPSLSPNFTKSSPSSFSDFVRELSRQVVQAINPDLLIDLDSLLEPFLERPTALRERSLSPYSAGSENLREAARLLAAIYAATQTVVAELSADELERLSQENIFGPFLVTRAEQEAISQGIEPSAARSFANYYAEIVAREVSSLKALVTI